MIPSKYRPFDSSKTRVVPAFNIINKDPETRKRFIQFVFARRHKISTCATDEQASALLNFDTVYPLRYGTNGRKTDGITTETGEMKIPPRKDYLEWLIENTSCSRNDLSGMRSILFSKTKEKRDAAIAEAHLLITKNWNAAGIHQSWYYLEGNTSPDVYIETDTYILVIEAKRTEGSLTSSTKWVKCRNQMIRHMDALYGQKGLPVYGLYIITGDADSDKAFQDNGYIKKRKFPNHAKSCIKTYSDPNTWKSSLPDRTPLDVQAIRQGFLGYITWEEIIKEFPNIGKNGAYPFCVTEGEKLCYI